jgi:amidase
MAGVPPNVRPPSPDEVREAAAEHHLDLTDEEVEVFTAAVADVLAAHDRIDELYEPDRTPLPDRRAVTGDPDRHNAFATRCVVEPTADGPLAGVSVGLKDNVSLAGIEMRCGSRALSGYVPDRDATVVTRLLEAGATIAGKLNMESMAKSGSGELSDDGAVRNPHDPDHLAGGSSSGSGAAVAAGEVDVSLGTDQGGSIRIPAAWCGCVGLKPTFGLVPYTGIVGLGHTFDHVGPLARTVERCAQTLQVLAGPDGLDPRQSAPDVGDYAGALTDDPQDIEVGVLAEGFGLEDSRPAVDETVRRAVEGFADAGAAAVDVSVPMHTDGALLWTAINYSAVTALVRDEGVGHFSQGYYDTSFQEAFAAARRTRADQFPPTLKVSLIAGQYLADAYHGRYHARAQNLRRDLRRAYDEALADVDVLALPTVPKTAHPVAPDRSLEDALDRAHDMAMNTAPFDITGHPAVSVPCGPVEGLPVGLMFVGRRHDDETVLAAASAFESAVGWDELRL